MKLCLAIFQNYMRQRFIMNISKLDNLVYTIVKDIYERRRGRKIKI